MTTIKTEGFAIPNRYVPRPEVRRSFPDGSMTVDTNDLAALTPQIISPFSQNFQYDPHFHPNPLFQSDIQYQANPEPPISNERSRSPGIGKAPRTKQRKLSMSESRPRGRATGPPRAMSFSHSDRLGLGIALDTHMEGHRTDSISPPHYYGMAIPQPWQDGSSLPSMMQSFGSSVNDAILDSPITPAQHLSLFGEDEQKKQRRRECHNQVEKRRREHINAKIEELGQLLPLRYQEEAIDDEEEEPHDGVKKKRRSGSAAKAKEAAQCKGRVLTHSVQYIHDLHHLTQTQANRIQQLESWLASTGFSPTAQTNLPPVVWEQPILEAMGPSPEPEPIHSLTWLPPQPLLEFDPSPPDMGEYSRSSSSSAASRYKHSEPSPNSVEERGRTRERILGMESAVELPLAMSGMDLDSMFNRREDEMMTGAFHRFQ